MNATIDKFGHPLSLVADYDHWVVLLRPAQVTLGSLVLAAKGTATAYGDLSPEAFANQGRAVADIERILSRFTQFERLNYLMLMMVDPHVHFHVVPRYSGARAWRGMAFADTGWPGPPDLGTATVLTSEQVKLMSAELQALCS